jgi:hypothetical protein
MRRNSSYLGGHTVFRIPDYWTRVAHRRRVTKQHIARLKAERKRFEAELEAFEKEPKTRLIKRLAAPNRKRGIV